ncbi:MAG: hypothetical protein ACOC5D_02940, partial [Thermoplasmatota archaeon]
LSKKIWVKDRASALGSTHSSSFKDRNFDMALSMCSISVVSVSSTYRLNKDSLAFSKFCIG